MKFSEQDYQRPDLDGLKARFFAHIAELESAATAQLALTAVQEIQKIQNHIDTLFNVVGIRNSINTQDSFYEAEMDFWDEQRPLIEEWTTSYYRVLLASPWRSELATYLPETFFALAENSLRIFDVSIIPLLQEENKLATEYTKLLASAKIEFQGATHNLSAMGKFAQDEDRNIRRQAYDLVNGFFAEHEADFDRIYDQLVKVRHQIALALGFKDFVEVGYLRMNRLDYNRDQVEVYRKEILEHVVPLAQKLYDRQTKRLGLEALAPYDLLYKFKTGNAMPQGTAEDILAAGVNMYHELSPETAEFIDFMVESDLLDLVTKPGKAGGGYCTYMPDYQAPFIFSNFNGTSADVDVLTHEAGHAFQVFQSRWIQTPECVWPTYESCEIHSMSMEFLAWPWMEHFFGQETTKYKFSHLSESLIFLPYGVLVDHFQHEVYLHPEMTPAERRATWRRLEATYLPWKQYETNSFLDRGGFWFRQAHIFENPFYYIDYTLAQVCAFQFWKRSQVDHDPQAWEDYLAICRLGGTKSFLQIVQTAHLKSPFEAGSLVETVSAIDQYLEAIPESAFEA